MIYSDFLNILNRAKRNHYRTSAIDEDDFHLYTVEIDRLFLDYFISINEFSHFGIINERAAGKTLQEIGSSFGITRERVRQILNFHLGRLRNPSIIEGNRYLYRIFSLLCGIGESEIVDYLNYLLKEKHLLVLVLKYGSDEQAKQSRRKKIFAPKNEVESVIIKLLSSSKVAYSFSSIADILVRDYRNYNLYGFTKKVTWNRVMKILYDMELEGKISRLHGYVKLVKIGAQDS